MPPALVWAGIFVFVWWIATGHWRGSWWVGVPTVIVASAVAVALRGQAPRLRWSALPSFLWLVLARSAVGSVDVALRAVRPKLTIEPTLFEHRLRHRRGAVLLATLLSLLPGTLAARLEEDRLVVHSLSSAEEARRELALLEERIERLLGGR